MLHLCAWSRSESFSQKTFWNTLYIGTLRMKARRSRKPIHEVCDLCNRSRLQGGWFRIVGDVIQRAIWLIELLKRVYRYDWLKARAFGVAWLKVIFVYSGGPAFCWDRVIVSPAKINPYDDRTPNFIRICICSFWLNIGLHSDD